jgi:hypothetical protein
MPHELSRRTALALGLASASAAEARIPAMTTNAFELAAITASLAHYDGLGIKASGGNGDQATGLWLSRVLEDAGFSVSHQPFSVPWFEVAEASLTSGSTRAEVLSQAMVVTTPPEGIEGPLFIHQAWSPERRYDGGIVLVVLPYRRWSTLMGAEPRRSVETCFKAGAAAVVLVTTGPTGEALALNAPADRPVFDRPVAVLAPREARPLLALAEQGARGVLKVTGQGGRREAYNVVGQIGRPGAPGLVVSTPRSGWFGCAGERGGGIAAWIALALWAPKALKDVSLTFLSTSGHEYENEGGETFLTSGLAPPDQTQLWVHLGANVASRDFNELAGLVPLKSPDTQRILMVTADLVPLASRLFAGQPGLENVVTASKAGAAGEMSNILAHDYPTVAGVFGGHRFHHARNDDLTRTHPEATLKAGVAFRDLISASLG